MSNAGGCLFEHCFWNMSAVNVGHVLCSGLTKAVREAFGQLWALCAESWHGSPSQKKHNANLLPALES